MKTQKLTFSINPLVIIVALILVIIGMIALWQPWQTTRTERTITITGQGEVHAIPDEFTFSPYFERTGSESSKLKDDLAKFGNTLLEEVGKLGVSKDNITLSSSNYASSGAAAPAYPSKPVTPTQETVTMNVSIKTTSKEIAQKVQDYLATTDAKGTTTPQPNFSKQKQQQLESDARQKATQDARQKAEKTAKDVGTSIGKVVKVNDKSQGGIVPPMYAGAARDGATLETTSSLPVTPGKDTVTLSVEVTFELR